MVADSESSTTRRSIPTLVQICQRVALAHVESITSLGDDIRYSIAKPILERCTAEQLLRLEQVSPHLEKDTPEIWKNNCFRKYATALEGYASGEIDEPGSWRDLYFVLHEAEAKRLEEAGTKLRNQRLEAEERKREREVKFTDRLPPPKRTRSTGWSTNVQPKTLFQKTRTEASKIQKTMYTSRMTPPMPSGRTYRVLPQNPGASLPPSTSPTISSRVTVNTVVHRRPAITCSASTPLVSLPIRPSASTSMSSALPAQLSPTATVSRRQPPTSSAIAPVSTDPRPMKLPAKRDPMASLFVPKHRAYSQRPA